VFSTFDEKDNDGQSSQLEVMMDEDDGEISVAISFFSF